MYDERVSLLESRLKRLELTNRLLTLGCALAVIVMIPLACGPGTAHTVRAQRFELVDQGGETRGVIFADEQGGVISLDDADGNVRVTLAAGRESPGLEIFGPNQQRRAVLNADADGATLAIADDRGGVRATVGMFQDEAWVAILDPQGQIVYAAPATE